MESSSCCYHYICRDTKKMQSKKKRNIKQGQRFGQLMQFNDFVFISTTKNHSELNRFSSNFNDLSNFIRLITIDA